ncbi:MAG: PAS domain-containing sensor histidine kinase [Bauldia sp.]|nr:PAS domain-containing sensor histidine kinase [Bauldia sp.]
MTTTAPAIRETVPLPPSTRGVAGHRSVRLFGYASAILALLAASVTFFIFLGLTSIEPTPTIVTWALAINGVLLVCLLGAVGIEIARLWMARRRGEAAARLHIRIVALFALVAVTPALLVAVVANVTFAQGVDHWFSSRTQEIVENSTRVAETYNATQLNSLGNVMTAMKADIEANRGLLTVFNRQPFQSFLDSLPDAYGTPGVFLVSLLGDKILQASSSAEQSLPRPPPAALEDAAANPAQPAIILPRPVVADDGTELVFAGGVAKLAGFDDVYDGGLYLYVVVPFDPLALGYLNLAADNAAEFAGLMAIRSGMQAVFGLIYFGVALIVLAAAIWLGLAVANRLVSPIGRLIDASDRVAGGDLEVGVPVDRADGDLAALGSSFNKMTAQLRGQRKELLAASEQIDSRRRFMEAVLSGVTAGVVGVDGEGRVTILNRMALRLLNLDVATAIGAPIGALVPELGPAVTAAAGAREREHQTQIVLARGGRSRTINVRVTNEGATSASGYVVTLDDITDLVTAQRTAVWADVARRIAHEIKNPLTPIQLSAERLRRKFGRIVVDDREIFDQCIDTIIRQVGDIGRMVDEFASFARMPKPALAPHDVRKSVREAVFMMQTGYPDIEIRLAIADHPLVGLFDERLIAQVLTNLIKNATEAISAVPGRIGKGRIDVRAAIADRSIVLDVIDNGVGLPKENRQLILEPYMTTREKGTGLGLAIVKKIVEDHAGRIELLDAPAVAEGGQGAMIRLTFPELDRSKGASPGEAAARIPHRAAIEAADNDALAPVAE